MTLDDLQRIGRLEQHIAELEHENQKLREVNMTLATSNRVLTEIRDDSAKRFIDMCNDYFEAVAEIKNLVRLLEVDRG